MSGTNPQTSTAQLPPEFVGEIQNALIPLLGDTADQRRALLTLAFGNSPILYNVEVSGESNTFIPNLISRLWNYGKADGTDINALAVLLRKAAEQTGTDNAATIHRLADTIEGRSHPTKQAEDNDPHDPELPDPDKTKPLLFLCHGKEDKVFARLLYRRLVEDGCYPWLDEAEILPGDDWESEINGAIERSDRFILCLSTRTIGERFWQKEISNALAIAEARNLQTGYILPVRFDDCPIPQRLASRHATALFPCSAQHLNRQGYKLLIRAIQRPLPGTNPVEESPVTTAISSPAPPVSPPAFTPRVGGISSYRTRIYPPSSQTLPIGTEILLLSGHTYPVWCASFSPDGTRIVTASDDKTARVWDIRETEGLAITGKVITTLRGHTDLVWSASFSPDGTRIVTASGDKTARVWDIRETEGLAITGKVITTLRGHSGEVNSASFSPDGTRIVTASDDKTARVWDIRETEGLAITGKVITTLSGHTGWVNSASFSPDGKRIVTASDDKTARVWDIHETEGLATTGKVITTLSGHTNYVYSASFSPDGTRIVTASDDKTARVWDAQTGKVITTLSGHTSYVVSASFSPDGTRIVTASDDKTARVWDIRETEGSAITGKVITTLSGHTSSVLSASFSPDGKRIVTASDDKTARVWWVGS